MGDRATPKAQLMTLLRLTDDAGQAIYFNVDSINVVRSVAAGESVSAARAAVGVTNGFIYVQETVTEIVRRLT